MATPSISPKKSSSTTRLLSARLAAAKTPAKATSSVPIATAKTGNSLPPACAIPTVSPSIPRGDLFTYDADAEFDMGSPWYRPTRVDQLVSGTDFGWRGVTGKWPPYFPDHADNALPTLDIGRGSPTAVAFGTNSNFPPDYRRALFILDWAYGRIVAVNLAPAATAIAPPPKHS